MKNEYLIKNKNKALCYFGIGYIRYVYDDQTWASSGPRKRAKVFTKEEAKKFVSKWTDHRMVKK